MTRRRAPLIVAVSTLMVVGAAPLAAVGLDEPALDEPTASEAPVEETGEDVTGTTTDGTSELEGGSDGTLTDPTSDTSTDATDGLDAPLADGTDLELDATTDDDVLVDGTLSEDPDGGLLEPLFAFVEDTTDPSGDEPEGDVEDSGDADPTPPEEPAGQDGPAGSTDSQEPAVPASQDDPRPPATFDAPAAASTVRTPVRPAGPYSVPPAQDLELTARDGLAGLSFRDLRLPDFGERTPIAPWVSPFGSGAYTRHPGQRTTAPIVGELLRLDVEPHVIGNVLAPFPVAGLAVYADDWGAPRYVPTVHAHEGTDIFAARGTPVVASFDGVISHKYVDSRVGGNGLKLATADGTYAYYAHLDGFAPGVVPGARVAKGTVLGFVGDTGNAVGTPPHLHYELHPGGGQAVPPVPYLDAWLEEARAEVLLIRGPGIDGSLLRPAPVPIPPPAQPLAQPGAGGAVSPGLPSPLSATPAGLDTRGLTLLSVWVLAISVGYVLHRRRGMRRATGAAAATATTRSEPPRDVLAPLLPAPERRPAHLAA